MNIPGYHSGAYLTYNPFGYLFPLGDGSHMKSKPQVGIEPTSTRLQSACITGLATVAWCLWVELNHRQRFMIPPLYH